MFRFRRGNRLFAGVGLVALLALSGCNQGNIKTTLLPPAAVEAGAQWAVDGGDWQASGTTLEKIKAGDHVVTFKPVNGWNTPANTPITLANKQTAEVGAVYTPTIPVDVTVPVLAGGTQADAAAALEIAQLVLGTTTGQCSFTVPLGNVIGQDPAPGNMVTPGSSVDLIISTGPCTTNVPNVVGQTQSAASSAIAAAGLVPGTVTMQCSPTVTSGKVISQTPAANSSAISGISVSLVVSTGLCNGTVPNAVGQTQTAATTTITGAGFVLGTVAHQCSNTVASGTVISQLPAAATSATLGSAVNLVVSSGTCNTTVPNIVGQSQSAATAIITGAGLAIGTVTQQCSNTVALGNVISQTPAANASASSGSAVSFVLSIGPCNVTVPNVVGQTQAAATTSITGAGLVLGTVTQQCSPTVASGQVISQTPAANTSTPSGGPVNLVVSTGVCNVTVPNVVGQTQAAATTAITVAGLVRGTLTQQCSASVASGNVISQTPAAGTSASTGSAVALVVSTGPCTVNAPNVVGQTQAAATTSITTAGLSLGTVTHSCSNTVASGNVISQTPAANTPVAPGSSVNVVVANGPCTVPVPDLSGKTQAQATAAISAAGLIPATPTEQCSATVPLGQVVSQSPVKDTAAQPGTTVSFVISNGICMVSVPSVVNYTQAVAGAALAHASLQTGTVTQQCSNTVPTGDVISQSVSAGQSAPAGSEVNLTVSAGVCRASVPNVVGKTQAAATTSLTGAGLAAGSITQECSNLVTAGNVIRQAPAANASVSSGASVDLVISSGACAELACSNSVLLDGSFEGGTPNKFWTVTSTNNGTPLTNTLVVGKTAHTGSWWAWFGNLTKADQSSLTQTKTIPAAASATLSFYLRILAAGTGSGTLAASIDGKAVASFTNADKARFANYTQVVLDVSNYADGASHAVSIGAGTSGANALNYMHFLVDDVCLSTSSTPNSYPLTISRTGSGSGTVTGTGIDCGGDCSGYFTDGNVVHLTATPDDNSTLVQWTGADSASGNTCTVTVDRAKTVTAEFGPRYRSILLNVIATGGATGNVTDLDLNCTGTCTLTYPSGTSVPLFATAGPGSKFTGWTGVDASSGNTAVVLLAADKPVTATFVPDTRLLGVDRNGSGHGTVTSSVGGINCGSVCSANILVGTPVTLTATANADSEFSGWTGADTTNGNKCTVTMDTDKDIQARFTFKTYQLTVAKTGSGTVVSTGAGINCGNDCSETYDAGTPVVLTATPAVGYIFSSWTNADQSSGNTCQVTLNSNRTVTANFTAQNYTLNITKSGNGTGTVTSGAAGISCGADCTESYPAGMVVTLMAAADSGSSFSSWTGADTTTGNTCTIRMNGDKTISAAFVLPNYTLNTVRGGNGKGKITANGIDCPGDCTESYLSGTRVSLAANVASDSTFTGWSGDISGTTNPYDLLMNSAKNVTANFALKTYTLTTGVSGQGTISPAVGNHSQTAGDSVQVSATAAQGWKFDHWSGDLAGSLTPMALAIDGNKSVTAVFVQVPSTYTLQITKTGSGTVTTSDNSINCGGDCSEAYPTGKAVTLTATPAQGFAFQGWGGALSGTTTPTTITMDAAKTVNAVFSAAATTYVQIKNEAHFPIVDLQINGQQQLPAGYQMNCNTFSPLIPVTGATFSIYAGIGYILPSGAPVTYRGQSATDIPLDAGVVNPVTITANMSELLSKFQNQWSYDTTDYCSDHTVNYRLVFYNENLDDHRWELYSWINLQANPHWQLSLWGTVTDRPNQSCGGNPVVFTFSGSPYMVNQTYYPQLEVGSNGYDLLHIISPCDGSTILFCRDTPGQDKDAPPVK